MANIELNLALYKKLYLIRRSEELICQHYFDDEMKTPMHMSMGGEAISVGVCHALTDDDQVYGTYRSHAAYLAKTGDTDNFFAEMHGKVTSLQKGKSGSMHLAAPESGLMVTSAIVGTSVPVAVGAAFAQQQQGKENLVVAFFGDGATDTGVFWESLNVACLMRLPVLFICEDNNLAVHSSKSARNGYKSILDIVSKFECNVFSSESTDVESIYNLILDVISKKKESQIPCFVHLKYYRYLEHVGTSMDFDSSYRSKKEFQEWQKKDPVDLQEKKLFALGQKREVRNVETDLDVQIQRSFDWARSAPFPTANELYHDVYA